jgi:hypothetical protein
MRTRVVLALVVLGQALLAQGVGIGTSTPHPSAILELSSTTKGLLIPRLTEAERQALPDPATGLLIFNTTTGELNFYNGSSWRRIPSNAVSAASGTGTPSGEGVGIDASGGIGIPDPSAILDVKATDKGVLIPRTTPAAVPGPVAGLTIYNTSTNLLNYFDGTSWREPCGVLVDNNKGIGAVAGSGVAINTTGDPPHPSARLDVTHTSKGLLLPRLTSAQRDAVINPAVGLIIFNTTAGRIEYWRGNQWMRLMELPMQPSTITGPTSVCQGASNVSYSVTNVPGISYNWSYSGSGFTITSGAGTHAITGNFSASATSGTLTVTPSNACGNGPAQSVSVTVDPNSTAPTNVSADHSTICEGQSTTLRASGGTAGTGSSLVWYAGGCGGGATQVGTGSSITVRPTSTTTYFVRREGGCGTPTSCASVTVTVNANSTAPTNVSADHSTICEGQSTTLRASGGTAGTGSSLVWYAGGCGGGATQVGTGSSITVRPTSTTTYFVRREGGCGTPTSCASVTVTVNANSTAPTNVSADHSTICEGQSTTLRASGGTAGTGSSLVWYAGGCGGGATQVGTGSSITVRPTSTTTYFVRREGGCGTPTSCASVTVTVNANSTAPTNVSADHSTICAGQSTTLNASGGTAGTGSSLVWYAGGCGGGATQVGTGSSITVRPTSTTTYYVRREGGCGTPTGCASVTVTVNDVPGPGTVSGPTTLCRGQSYAFSTTNNATSYTWRTTGASEITFTGSGHSVTVNVGPGTTNSTNICVTPSNSCGNGSDRCQSVNIIAPPSVGPISGPTTVCKGKSGVVFSVPNQPGVTYDWSYSGSGVNIVNGQGTHSITADFSMTATPGVLRVTVSNACGSASSSRNITIHTPYWAVVNANCGNSNCTPYIWRPQGPCTGDDVGARSPYAECDQNGTIECFGEWECMCGP